MTIPSSPGLTLLSIIVGSTYLAPDLPKEQNGLTVALRTDSGAYTLLDLDSGSNYLANTGSSSKNVDLYINSNKSPIRARQASLSCQTNPTYSGGDIEVYGFVIHYRDKGR